MGFEIFGLHCAPPRLGGLGFRVSGLVFRAGYVPEDSWLRARFGLREVHEVGQSKLLQTIPNYDALTHSKA